MTSEPVSATPLRSESSAGLSVHCIADLPGDAASRNFLGIDHGDLPVSLILIDHQPGDGPDLHEHDYAEVIVVIAGEMTITDGSNTSLVRAGEIAIAPAGHPHGFKNTGSGQLRSIDIHLHDQFVTRWLH